MVTRIRVCDNPITNCSQYIYQHVPNWEYSSQNEQLIWCYAAPLGVSEPSVREIPFLLLFSHHFVIYSSLTALLFM